MWSHLASPLFELRSSHPVADRCLKEFIACCKPHVQGTSDTGWDAVGRLLDDYLLLLTAQVQMLRRPNMNLHALSASCIYERHLPVVC